MQKADKRLYYLGKRELSCMHIHELRDGHINVYIFAGAHFLKATNKKYIYCATLTTNNKNLFSPKLYYNNI